MGLDIRQYIGRCPSWDCWDKVHPDPSLFGLPRTMANGTRSNVAVAACGPCPEPSILRPAPLVAYPNSGSDIQIPLFTQPWFATEPLILLLRPSVLGEKRREGTNIKNDIWSDADFGYSIGRIRKT